jgi:hypothetical protein
MKRTMLAGLAALVVTATLTAQPVEEVQNWPVTVTTWTPAAAPGPESTAESLPTEPLPFIGIEPCRLVDTRLAGKPTGYGPPRLSAGAPRTFVMTGQPHCFVPPSAEAVSVNVTAVDPAGQGNIRIYPADVGVPTVSTVNFRQGQNTANAAIVPLAGDGSATVLVSISDADVVIDVNGYFGGALQTLTWKGPWSGSAVYGVGDLVSHQGSSWVSRTAGNQGTAPAAGVAAWDLVAQKGADGPQGPQGPQGPPGAFNGQKVCVLDQSGTQVTLLVPSTWAWINCAQLSGKLGPGAPRLGCVFANSFSIGAANPQSAVPNPNCGW